jgi:3alpha(or 20beta)-hydroxysteroid dehydrogenase
VVTGAAGGIGRGVVEMFAAEGAAVHAVDVREAESYVGDISFVRMDVTDEDAWVRLVEQVERDHGVLDVIVNNAGVTGFDAVHELTMAEWRRIVGINQTGVFLGMRAAIPAMMRAGRGSIVNISSICGASAVPGLAAYHASKGAVLLMTKNAAITYATKNIRANAILPGWIRTPMTMGQADELNQAFIDATPMRRGAEPEDVAMAALFLASDESSFITGVDLPVDGGYLAC